MNEHENEVGETTSDDDQELAAAEESAALAEPAASDAQPAPPPPTGLKTIEQWAEELATPKWLFAGMKLGKGWAIGQEVTREVYEAAVKWAATIDCR